MHDLFEQECFASNAHEFDTILSQVFMAKVVPITYALHLILSNLRISDLHYHAKDRGQRAGKFSDGQTTKD